MCAKAHGLEAVIALILITGGCLSAGPLQADDPSAPGAGEGAAGTRLAELSPGASRGFIIDPGGNVTVDLSITFEDTPRGDGLSFIYPLDEPAVPRAFLLDAGQANPAFTIGRGSMTWNARDVAAQAPVSNRTDSTWHSTYTLNASTGPLLVGAGLANWTDGKARLDWNGTAEVTIIPLEEVAVLDETDLRGGTVVAGHYGPTSIDGSTWSVPGSGPRALQLLVFMTSGELTVCFPEECIERSTWPAPPVSCRSPPLDGPISIGLDATSREGALFLLLSIPLPGGTVRDAASSPGVQCGP